MKNLIPYLTLISMSVFGIWVSFTWNIPVDNQIGMFFLSCMCIGLFFMVLRQNSYASRVIEIQQNQKVIDYGLYSKVRHPMYVAAIIIMLSSPLVLGSYYALIPMALYPLIIIFRIKNEEEVLKKGLAGYDEYLKKVKYRLIPLIW